MQVQPHHWALWGREASGPCKYVDIGFRHQTEFYTPPRRGEIDSADSAVEITDDDMILSRQLGMGVDALRRVDNQGAMYLVHWFGAYPGSPSRRGERVAKMGIAPNRAHEVVKVYKAWVEGWVHNFRDFHAAA